MKPHSSEARGRREVARLLEKYDKAIPRYTSYPPANHFHAAVGAGDHRKALAEIGPEESFSVYVHIPFCEHRCTYCACFVVPTTSRAIASKYLEYLLRELELTRAMLPARARPAGLHLGGGTPTYLLPVQLDRLLGFAARRFGLGGEGVEVSVELDPRVTTEEHLDVLRARGVSRLSLGVQDTCWEVQAAIGRFQSHRTTETFFQLCREKGFTGINIDLVYGLPLQTKARFQTTLDHVLALRPERFAVFGYAHVPWMRPHQSALDVAALPPGPVRRELYLAAHKAITAAGYRHLGLDHFALPDDDLCRAQEEGRLGRNFMGYTARRGQWTVGAGVSSISEMGSGYFQNQKKLAKYFETLDRGELPVERGLLMTPDDRARRRVIQDVLCRLEVDFRILVESGGVPFAQYFAAEMQDLAELEADGLITLSTTGLEVRPEGRLFLRNVAAVFDRYLREKAYAAAGYSPAV